MEWKSIEKDGPPQEDGMCYVAHENGWSQVKAWYWKHLNVFSLRDEVYKAELILAVTHYIEIPEFRPNYVGKPLKGFQGVKS